MNILDLDDDTPIQIIHERVPISQIYDKHVDELILISTNFPLTLSFMILLERFEGPLEVKIEKAKEVLEISIFMMDKIIEELIQIRYLVRT